MSLHRNDIDPYVALAQASYTAYVRDGLQIAVPSDIPVEMLAHCAGVFVSLHEEGRLRGCIGTIEPMRASIAEEIICNAISACSEDPRFPAVRHDELAAIICSVDVLTEPEDIEGFDALDPSRFGVIVTSGWHRGVLLPDLEGIDTVEMQVSIAKRKAGIPQNDACTLQRFQVVRHT
jgi:AmmeMemoRadiSam system protein A